LNEHGVKQRLIELIDNMSEEHQRDLLNQLDLQDIGYRKHLRKSCSIATDYTIKDKLYKDFITNISAGGVYIKTYQPQSAGQKVSMTFVLPKFNKPIRINGKIVRSSSQGFAIKFYREAKEFIDYLDKTDEMSLIKIDESSYSLEQIYTTRNASNSTRSLFNKFNENLIKEFQRHRWFFHGKTHQRGISYVGAKKKAFIIVDINRDFLSLRFFTGHGGIPNLKKGTWLKSGDNLGSERYRIVNENHLEQAVFFASKAYELMLFEIGL